MDGVWEKVVRGTGVSWGSGRGGRKTKMHVKDGKEAERDKTTLSGWTRGRGERRKGFEMGTLGLSQP